ncbi:unnamed protein product, partial [Phaeothamnion confervicola]
ASGAGHLDIVIWLHENRDEGCSRRGMPSLGGGTETLGAMDAAATNGHLPVLQFLAANRGEGFTATGVHRAAANGHLGV